MALTVRQSNPGALSKGEAGVQEERIANIAADIWEEEIPLQTVHLLKRNLLDSYAGICASLLDRQMLGTMGNYAAMAPDETGLMVWGVGIRTQPIQTVFLNTILGRRSDLVNTYLSPDHMGGNHPSDNVSLLLTLADWKNLSGKKLLRAIYTAFVLSCGYSDHYNPEAAGYDHDALAPFYTALIAGLLEGLDQAGLVEAQRIAGAMGLNPDQTGLGLVSDWKHCTFASCAKRGVEAALLAKAGFNGPVDIYQGEAGWNRFVPHGAEFMRRRPDLDRIVFKSWQALVFCQTAIDAAAAISPAFWRATGGRWHASGSKPMKRPCKRPGGKPAAGHLPGPAGPIPCHIAYWLRCSMAGWITIHLGMKPPMTGG